MPGPRLSIVAPTFNRAHMLPRFLESIRTVTSDCEILVVDNASTDDTPAVVQRYAATDARIRHIRNSENIGVIANYNRAMELTSGEFICCMGDDDAVLPGNFERKLALLDGNPNIGFVYSQWLRMDENGRSLGVCQWPGLLPHSYIGGRAEFLDLLPACYIHLQGVVFRRELFKSHGGVDMRPEITAGQDWDMLLRWAFHSETAFIAEPLVCVGIHAESQTESVCRTKGHFAQGRVAIWRKWLVERDNPPVLDDSRWHRMREAFVPDLRYEFGGDNTRVEGFLAELDALRQSNQYRILQRFDQCLTGSVAQPPRRATTRPIVWHAPVRDPSGYADEARHFLFALDNTSVQLAARELRWNDRVALLTTDRERTLTRLLASPAAPNAMHVWHILAPHFQVERSASANVGRTMFETDRLPEGWAESCNRMDAVWVPTEFNRQTFSQAGVAADKIAVVPGAIDMTPFDRRTPALRINGARGFNFLSIFDWSLRKGWDVLIRAYVEEFQADEDVALLFKIHSSMGESMETIVRRVESFLVDTLGRDPNRIPDVVFQDTNIPDSKMPGLYRAADCYVMPTRGEGWGRPIMEAMAMGLPAIATNWSGQTEYMNSENSLPIDFSLVDVPEPAWREIPTYRGHRWAEPDGAHLRQMMRLAFEDRAGCRQIGERARADIAERFNYQTVAEQIAREIDRFAYLSDGIAA
jgi:glycosyltransferase involved in cell wall biosynthesis